MNSSLRTILKTYSGYFIVAVWFLFLAGLGYTVNSISQEARSTLISQLFPTANPTAQTAAAPAATEQPTVTAAQGLAPELRAQLSIGLDTLTNILKDFQAKTASASDRVN